MKIPRLTLKIGIASIFILYLLLFLGLHLILKGLLRIPRDESELARFNVNSELSILYPDYWSASETPFGSHGDDNALASIVPPSISGVPRILIAKFPSQDADINSVSAWGRSRVRYKLGFYQLPVYKDKTELIAYSDYFLTGYVLFGVRRIRCEDLYMINANNGYSFSFCAWESDWNTYLQLFRTMQVSITFDLVPQ